MLPRLRRESHHTSEVAPSKPSSIEVNEKQERANTGCIEALAKGDLTARSGCDEPTSRALNELAEHLAGSASRDLDRAVALSIQSSETAITAAKMIRALRSTDERTELLAAASEELVS